MSSPQIQGCKIARNIKGQPEKRRQSKMFSTVSTDWNRQIHWRIVVLYRLTQLISDPDLIKCPRGTTLPLQAAKYKAVGPHCNPIVVNKSKSPASVIYSVDRNILERT